MLVQNKEVEIVAPVIQMRKLSSDELLMIVLVGCAAVGEGVLSVPIHEDAGPSFLDPWSWRPLVLAAGVSEGSVHEGLSVL